MNATNNEKQHVILLFKV